MNIDKQFPVGNAAGWCKSVVEVKKLAESAASFIVVGSITVWPRGSNPGNTFSSDALFGLNSLGLPNPGCERMVFDGEDMIAIANCARKPIIMSVAGLDPKEYQTLVVYAHDIGFDGIEINLGCPNMVCDNKRKPIISYSAPLVEASLDHAFCRDLTGLFVSVKVSPMDPLRLDEIASVIEEFPVDAVVTQNTVPNCLDFDEQGKPVIDTPDKTGYAGGSGRQIFQQALGQVQQWRRRLPERIAVWGVGGVQTGIDVQKMLWAGASVVQVGTAYFVHGAKVFGDIASQFINLEG